MISETAKCGALKSLSRINPESVANRDLVNTPPRSFGAEADIHFDTSKLCFGVIHLQENHLVRTFSINPIFSAITSISTILIANNLQDQAVETEKFHQVYLRFSSSNYFWENLEKTAEVLEELEGQLAFFQKPVVSMTGATPTSTYFYATNSTQIPDIHPRISGLDSTQTYSGSTSQRLYGH